MLSDSQSILLALIQGITEFLPISSSAHLILPSSLFGWPDQGLAFDIAVHLGTLLAVMWYFRSDIVSLSLAFIGQLGGKASKEGRFAINLIIASIPIIPAGLLLKPLIEGDLRSVDVIIITTIFFGIMLYVADRLGSRQKDALELNWKDALLIGFSQCFALIPGSSRSGVTISMALLLGYTRECAARISFLLSIPAIAGAGTLKTFDLITLDTHVDWQSLALGAGVSFISAYICIRVFLRLIESVGVLPFVIYRLALGGVLIWIVY
ncbi:MAG: undecaprenyl-diphosphatase [Candidatus Azotimanducaceae bacterium]|jgi:undecaprenyl-diphosphatase